MAKRTASGDGKEASAAAVLARTLECKTVIKVGEETRPCGMSFAIDDVQRLHAHFKTHDAVTNVCPVKGCDGTGNSRDAAQKMHYQETSCPTYQSISGKAPASVDDVDVDADFEVESIHDFRVIKGVRQYNIRWKGDWPGQQFEWMDEHECVESCGELISEYWLQVDRVGIRSQDPGKVMSSKSAKGASLIPTVDHDKAPQFAIGGKAKVQCGGLWVNGEIIMSKDLGSHRLVTMSLGREIDPPRHIVDPEIMKQNQTQKNKIQELQAANNEKDEIIDKFGTRLRMCLRFMARQGDKQINELDRAGLLDYDTPARIQDFQERLTALLVAPCPECNHALAPSSTDAAAAAPDLGSPSNRAKAS